jgi:hypothetical protein
MWNEPIKLTNKHYMNKYLLHGKVIAKLGSRDALAEVLIEASKVVATAQGCKLYALGLVIDF